MAAFVKAIEEKRFKQAELLLQLGDNVNQQEKHSGTTPLLAVCFLEDENLACRIANKLLHRGADVCLQDEDGMSPLMQACKLGKEKLVQAFIQSEECDFGAADSEGNTALIHSIEAGNSRITKALTEAMNIYDVRAADKPNKNGETPLIRAIKLKRNDCKEVLLSDGKASPCARDFNLKLNAREWESYLHKREENSKLKNKVIKERNFDSRESNRMQNEDQYELPRAKSSIFHCRQDLTNRATPLRHSVIFIEKSEFDEKVLGKRTKSAPLGKGENRAVFFNSETIHFQPTNKENCIDKWVLPAKEKYCFPQKLLQVEKKSKQHGVTMTTTVGSYNEHEKQYKVEGNVGPVEKEGLLSAALIQKKKTKNSAESRGIGGTSFSHQSQLPQLFSLMTEQKTHSFRSSAKQRIAEELPSSKRKSLAGKEASKRNSSRRGSVAIQRLCTARRRWSTALAAMDTLERFPSLYSRDNFQAFNPDNRAVMLDQPVSRSRRGSLQSNREVLGFAASKKEAKISAVSPNLARLDPDRSSLNRVKSSKPRPRLQRHSSDSSISTGSLFNRLSGVWSTTPVIEETEEAVVSDSE